MPPAMDNVSGCVVTNVMDLLLRKKSDPDLGLGPRAAAGCATAVPRSRATAWAQTDSVGGVAAIPRIGIKRSSISDSSAQDYPRNVCVVPPPPDGTPAAEARRAKHCPTDRSGSTPLVRALALHGVSGDSGSHLGSTLKPGGAVLTLGVFRRSRSVAYIRADASPSEVHVTYL
jgi:hypothetical protein